MYTAAPGTAVQPLARSVIASVTVSGTPCATVDDDPKLAVMSLRTASLSVRTFGPFDPSPGNGPAVSSGIGVQLDASSAAEVAEPAVVTAAVLPLAATVSVVAAVAVVPVAPVVPVVPAVSTVVELSFELQPTKARRAPPPRSCRTWRRGKAVCSICGRATAPSWMSWASSSTNRRSRLR